jgi:hypothetical protein
LSTVNWENQESKFPSLEQVLGNEDGIGFILRRTSGPLFKKRATAGAADWRLTKTEIDTLEAATSQIDFDKISGLPNLVRGLIPF